MAVVDQRVERSDPLFQLAQLKPLWLEIRVPLDRLSGVRAGAAVALPCESSDARVILIGRDVDPDSQTVMIRAEVHEGSDCLRPGQFLQVRLRVSGGEQRYRIPDNAVVRSREATLVFV